ncbi:cell division protein FtsB [Neisseria shayeganii]|uniref:Cell division protein FtsB n=1 Tax=Neisseria shayeganii TaxID=607712 RepID=A0A7D7N431_9NEIS|nr:cell division protein FtsB [Neisseria shayeganii]QMT40985.1 cell division protein FtsB [Neisseria shayeganii]
MKWVTLVLLAALLWLQQGLWLSKGGWRDMWRLEAEVEAQSLANDALVVRNQALAAEVEDLRNGQDAIAEIARTDLGYVQSGETFYRILPAETAAE